MAFTKLFVLTLVTAINLQEISGHGMMWDPINRSSAWRKGFPVEPNYTDNEHSCGGVGVCMEDYKKPQYRWQNFVKMFFDFDQHFLHCY